MKRLILAGLVLASLFFLGACDDGSSDGEDYNEATSLGEALSFSGSIEQVFDTVAQSVGSYTTGGDDDYHLVGDGDDGYNAWVTDTNTDGDVDIEYDATERKSYLYSSSVWTGISSSDPAMMTGIHILVYNGGGLTAGEDEIFYGDFSGIPAQWYDYFYVTIDTVLDGTYTDPDDGFTYTFDNVKLFSGWNRVIKQTSDGEAYSYTTGTISDGKWTYMDNPGS